MRILVVDDDASVRDVLATTLRVEGHDVETVDGPLAAFERFDDPDLAAPDLVVLDVMMPGQDGFAVLSQLRDHPWLYDVPVVMLTAKVGLDAQQQGWSNGCDGYVFKPFDVEDLLHQVDLVANAAPELRIARRRERLTALLRQ